MIIEDKDLHDFQNIVISALRYSLGRRTYITIETSIFIQKYKELIDERMCICMLRDIERYMEDRKAGLIKDDKCDYDSWIMLQKFLFKLAKEKGLNVIAYDRR